MVQIMHLPSDLNGTYSISCDCFVKFTTSYVVLVEVHDCYDLGPCYWIRGVDGSLPFTEKDVNYMPHLSVKKWNNYMVICYASWIRSNTKCFCLVLQLTSRNLLKPSVKNEGVVGAAPTGDAPTTSEWSTILWPTKVCPISEVWGLVYYHFVQITDNLITW